MASKQTVLVLGATGGGAGTDVVYGLLEDGSFVSTPKPITLWISKTIG